MKRKSHIENMSMKDLVATMDPKEEEKKVCEREKNIAEEKKPAYALNNDGTFTCDTCGKIYKQIGSMKKHLESNHSIFESISFLCKQCNKVFQTKKKLTRHENSKSCCSS